MSTGKNLGWSSPIIENVASTKAITISVTGGKGGVGKTSVALKLAKILASYKKRVLLIDCDYNLSNTAVKLGLALTDSFKLYLDGEKSLDQCIYKIDGLHILSACNGNLELFDHGPNIEKVVLDILYNYEQHYDYIFLDCPAGLNRENLTLNAYSTERIFVVVPDKSSITDSYSMLKILKSRYGIKENYLLVNRISSDLQFQRLVKTMSETVEKYLGTHLKILGHIRNEASMSDRFDKVLLGEENDMHKDFCQIVKKLTDDVVHQGISIRTLLNRDNENKSMDRMSMR